MTLRKLKPDNMDESSTGRLFDKDLTTTIIYIWAAEDGFQPHQLIDKLQRRNLRESMGPRRYIAQSGFDYYYSITHTIRAKYQAC